MTAYPVTIRSTGRLGLVRSALTQTGCRKAVAVLLIASTFLMNTAAGATRTWKLASGEQFVGEVVGLTGPIVSLKKGEAWTQVMLAELNDEDLLHVAEWINKQPAKTDGGKATLSPVAESLQGRLSIIRDGKLTRYEIPTAPEPEIYLIYFSAHWCGPCRAFTPKLVEAYRRLKSDPQLGPRFELIFISWDRNSAEQADYIKEANMPWPVMDFLHSGTAETVERWAGKGIPCLVALNRFGLPLLHSYRGSEYIGPSYVLKNTEILLKSLDPRFLENAPAGHRLAMAVRIQKNPKGSIPAKPYRMQLNAAQYQTLEQRSFEAILQIDEKGTVTDVTTKPELNGIYSQKFAKDAANWLFLPALEEGKPQAKTVRVPVSF